MILYVWWHNAYSQYQAGLEQYVYMDKNAISYTPVIWYQANSNWYAEARYNYDAEKTLSLYAGKTFEKQSKVSYSFSTMAGILMGQFNGGAIAVNTELEYKKIFLSLQSQYTFSIKYPHTNFIYNWGDIGYTYSSVFSAGISIQQTALCASVLDRGLFVKAQFGHWTLPLYVFNPERNERFAVLGLNFFLQQKKKTVKNNTQRQTE
jgi:hypothetical protein